MRRSIELVGLILVPALMLVLIPGCQAKEKSDTTTAQVQKPTTMPDHHPPARTPEN